MAKTNLNEDKIALLTGCFIFLLAALNLAHLDVLGWVVSTNMWTSMDKAFSATTGAYKGTISGVVSLLCTYVALTAILSFGIKLLGGNVARFVKSFTVVFFISEICYMFGANAHIAATPDAQAKFGIDWSIGLTTEAGFIVALVAGIFISNAFPRIAEIFEGRLPSRAVRQDRHRGPRRRTRREGRRGFRHGRDDHFPGPVRHRGSLSSVLGLRVLRSPQVLQVQP